MKLTLLALLLIAITSCATNLTEAEKQQLKKDREELRLLKKQQNQGI